MIVINLLLGVPAALIIWLFGWACFFYGKATGRIVGQPEDHEITWLDEDIFLTNIKVFYTETWQWFGKYIWGYPIAMTWYDFLRNPFEQFFQTYLAVKAKGYSIIDLRFFWKKYTLDAPVGARETTGTKLYIPLWSGYRLVSLTVPHHRDSKFLNSFLSIQFGASPGISWMHIPIAALAYFVSPWFLIAAIFPYFSILFCPVGNKYMVMWFGFFEDHYLPGKSNFGAKFIIDNKEDQMKWNPSVISPGFWEGAA